MQITRASQHLVAGLDLAHRQFIGQARVLLGSPNELAGYTMQKIQEYLSAGVRLVWVLFPESRSATVFRADGTASVIPADGALDGEDVIPGFRCELATIMPPAEPS